jgi:hypothetical protein
MAPCHQFADQALNILRYLAKKWNIDVEVPQQGSQEEADKLLQPSTSSLNFFTPNVSAGDFMCSWGAQGTSERTRQHAASAPPFEHGGGESMEGVVMEERSNVEREASSLENMEGGASESQLATTNESLENPLFWPFPMQGRPILPEGPQLKEAGFAPLSKGGLD